MPKRPQQPHFPITANPVHITYRLAGSVPVKTLHKLQTKRDEQLNSIQIRLQQTSNPEDQKSLRNQLYQTSVKFELAIDEILDSIKQGHFYLHRPPVQKIIMDSWLKLHRDQDIYLIAICVMGNHVHVIVKSSEPDESVDIGKLMDRHKTFTARESNKHLGRTGRPFWAKGYFDRTIRSGRFARALEYVVDNPVKAGIVNHWREWEGTFVDSKYQTYLG